MNTPQQMMEEIDRLARLCEAKYEEIAFWKNSHLIDTRQLKQQLSEQAEALTEVKTLLAAAMHEQRPAQEYNDAVVEINTVLSATSETIAAWRAKETERFVEAKAKLDVLAEVCSNAGCENLDDLKSMLNSAKETEPLHRVVAMLLNKIADIAENCPHTEYDSDCTSTGNADDAYDHGSDMARSAVGEQLRELLDGDTQATALAYEREVENRGAMKALEEATGKFTGTAMLSEARVQIILQEMAAELRVANKGEVK